MRATAVYRRAVPPSCCPLGSWPRPLRYVTIPKRLSPEAAVGLRGAAHGLHPLADDLVHLEELCATSVDADRLALEQVSLRVPVRGRIGLNALGVAGRDESVAVR